MVKVVKVSSLQLAETASQMYKSAASHAGEGFQYGATSGGVLGAIRGHYLRQHGVSGASPLKAGLATAALWGILGGVGGSLIKKREPITVYPAYGNNMIDPRQYTRTQFEI